MAIHSSKAIETSGDDDFQKMSAMMGPGHIDSSIRQSLQMLWMIMPQEKKNAGEVEKEFRRLVDRALRDLREDEAAFRSKGNA